MKMKLFSKKVKLPLVGKVPLVALVALAGWYFFMRKPGTPAAPAGIFTQD